jgi:AcrR family transcriptional regulator
MNKKKSLTVLGPRKAPKQDRSRQTYQVILNGASAIIRRDGIKKLSTNRVAEESGVSIGSLYQYFPSKAAIVAALIEQVLDEEFEKLKTLVEGLAPEKGAKKAACTFFTQYYSLNDYDFTYRRVLIEAVPTVEKSARTMQFHHETAEMILQFFRAHFAPGNHDLKLQLFIVKYFLKGVVLSSVDPEMLELDRTQLVAELAEMFMNFLKIPESLRSSKS